jgi:hypothetical protein
MTWTQNETIPGQKSKASPALSATGTALHMVHLGDSSNQLWHSMYDRRQWTENKHILNQKSRAAPAMAGDFLVHIGDSSNKLWYSRWISGENWVENQANNPWRECDTAPALTRDGNRLALVYKEDDSDSIVYSVSEQGGRLGSWTPTRRNGFLTRNSPGAAGLNGLVHAVHLGESSNNLWHSIYDPRRDAWAERRIEGQKSKAPPALAAFRGRIHMVHLGDSSNNLWHSIYDPRRAAWAERQIEGQKSKAPPALAAFGDRLHMVHLGDSSNNLWWSRWTDD